MHRIRGLLAVGLGLSACASDPTFVPDASEPAEDAAIMLSDATIADAIADDATNPDATIDAGSLDAGRDAGGPIVDLDFDGLDDAEERALLLSHLPFLAVDPSDGCPLAVALFRARPHPDDAALVQVIVDLLFERDCGAGGHPGDDEVFGMTIDPTLAPPLSVRSLRAIAHQSTACEEVSECGAGCGLSACDVAQGRPVVYFSRGKHGAYVSEATCDRSCFFTNYCTATSTGAAPPLFNVGEPDHPLIDDLTSIGAITSTAGWTEASLFGYDPWGPDDFGGAGSVRDDFLDPAFVTPPCSN